MKIALTRYTWAASSEARASDNDENKKLTKERQYNNSFLPRNASALSYKDSSTVCISLVYQQPTKISYGIL